MTPKYEDLIAFVRDIAAHETWEEECALRENNAEDLGRIPSFADWAIAIRREPRMGRSQKLSEEFGEELKGSEKQ